MEFGGGRRIRKLIREIKKPETTSKVVEIVRKLEEKKEANPEKNIQVPQGWKVERTGKKRGREEENVQENSLGKKGKFRIFEKIEIRDRKSENTTNIALGNKQIMGGQLSQDRKLGPDEGRAIE